MYVIITLIHYSNVEFINMIGPWLIYINIIIIDK